MQKYKIWQVKLSPSQLNDLENREDVPEWYRDYLDTTMYPTKDKVSKAEYLYLHTGNITAKSLNEVFHTGNSMISDNIEYLDNASGRRMHSLTVGDVVEEPDGTKHFVNFTGFDRL